MHLQVFEYQNAYPTSRSFDFIQKYFCVTKSQYKYETWPFRYYSNCCITKICETKKNFYFTIAKRSSHILTKMLEFVKLGLAKLQAWLYKRFNKFLIVRDIWSHLGIVFYKNLFGRIIIMFWQHIDIRQPAPRICNCFAQLH